MKIEELYFTNEGVGSHWFNRVKAYCKRGYSLESIAKMFRTKKCNLRVHYGDSYKMFFCKDNCPDYVGSMIIRRTVDATENGSYVVERKIGMNWVKMSDQNLCWLLGYLVEELDDEGLVRLGENGAPDYHYGYHSLMKYLSNLKPFTDYTMLTFMPMWLTEEADKLDFVY